MFNTWNQKPFGLIGHYRVLAVRFKILKLTEVGEIKWRYKPCIGTALTNEACHLKKITYENDLIMNHLLANKHVHGIKFLGTLGKMGSNQGIIKKVRGERYEVEMLVRN